MAQLQGFNRSEIEIEKPAGSGPIPKGRYLVVINKMDDKTSQTGNPYVQAELEVLEGEFARRRIWQNYYPESPNDVARRIALEHFKMMADAADFDPEETGDFVGKTMFAEVGIDKKDDQRNTVYGYSSAKQQDAPVSTVKKPAATAPQSAAVKVGAAAPWAKTKAAA